MILEDWNSGYVKEDFTTKNFILSGNDLDELVRRHKYHNFKSKDSRRSPDDSVYETHTLGTWNKQLYVIVTKTPHTSRFSELCTCLSTLVVVLVLRFDKGVRGFPGIQ